MEKEHINRLVAQLNGVIVVLERQVLFGRTDGETLALDKLRDARALLLGDTPASLERRNNPTRRKTE